MNMSKYSIFSPGVTHSKSSINVSNCETSVTSLVDIQRCCAVVKSCLTLCDPVGCSVLGSSVFHCFTVCSHLCPSSPWCHPTVSSSVVPFSSHLPSFPASGSFPVSQLFASGGHISIRASALASILLMNIHDWFPLGWTSLISLEDSQESSPTPQFKSVSSLVLSFLYSPALTSMNDYWKNHSFY